VEQALVSLYRANQEAFHDNMNRLKTGYILRVPDPAEFAALTKSDAKAEVTAQTADWNTYRQKLGIAPIAVAQTDTQRSASGKISVADAGSEKTQSADVLKISKAEAGAATTARASGALQERIKSLEEEVVAKEEAVKEANERVAILEKQVAEMKRLVELKGQAPTTAESKPEAAVASAPKAESESAPPQMEKPAAAKVAAPDTATSTSLLDEILQNPLYLAGLALVVILAGLFGIKALRGRQSETTTSTVVEEPTLAADQGEATETHAPTDTVITTASAEEMDPLAEAEVYLAYDREGQAEEILREGLRKTPARHELHLKLLEIYSTRRDFTSFDAVAQQLQNSSGGMGPTWERAAAMGYALNPNNPLYTREQPVDVSPIGETAGEPVFAVAPEEPTATVPGFDLDREQPEIPRTALAESDFHADETLILHSESEAPRAVEEHDLTPEKMIATIDFNLEKAATETDINFESPEQPEAEKPAFDFTPTQEEAAIKVEEPEVRKAGGNGQAGEFSFSSEQVAQPGLSDIDLNLEDQPAPSSTHDEIWQQVETKFDLARAYQEMGEKEGAREILEEVIKDGDAKQQRAARSMLANL
jgi:pilus assembly protein FimV